MNNQRMLASQTEQNLTHLTQKRRVRYTQDLITRMSRICQWPQDVKDRPNTDLPARRTNMLHSRMVCLGKHKTKANFRDTCGHLFRTQVNAKTQRLQDISAAAFTRCRTIAVFR